MKFNITWPVLFLACISGCTSIPTTPDTRSQEEKKTDFKTAISELSGEYDVVDSRNEIYLNYNFAAAKSLKVTTLGEDIIFKLIGKNNSELLIVGRNCIGNNHKLSTNFLCREVSSGMNFIDLGKEKHGYQIKSGALIGGFPTLEVHAGDYILSFYESGSGRPHYYILTKRQH